MDFFILGNPRSGTSLLRVMLNHHSKLGVPPESGLVQWWYAKYRDWEAKDAKDPAKVDAFITDILSSKKIEDWHLKRSTLRAIFAKSPASYQEVMDEIYHHYTAAEIIGDKNNYYIHHMAQLLEMYPDARYIHLVRDGRDVACSYLKIKQLDQGLKYIPLLSTDIEHIAEEWAENVNNVDAFVRSRSGLTVRYEDLLSDAEGELQRIFSYLAVPFEPVHMDFSSDHDEPESTMAWKGKLNSGLDKTNSKKYLSELSPEEVRRFVEVAGKTLTKFGYET